MVVLIRCVILDRVWVTLLLQTLISYGVTRLQSSLECLVWLSRLAFKTRLELWLRLFVILLVMRPLRSISTV